MGKLVTEEFVIENGTVTLCITRQEKVIVPDGVKCIGQGAFKGCTSLKHITLPDSVEQIEDYAFKGCRQLAHIRIPQKLQTVGSYAFHRCHHLEEIILPPSVKQLGNCAFLYCDSLRRADMPGVITFGKQTFLNDVNLEEIVLSPNVDLDSICECFTGCNKISKITLMDEQFGIRNIVDILSGKEQVLPLIRTIVKDIYAILDIEDGVLVRYLNNVKCVELPEGITAIAKSCFFDKRGIQSIVFPKSLRTIGARAFRGCMSLEKVEFQNEEVEIEDAAFQNCSALCEILLPDKRCYKLSGLKELSGSGVSGLVRKIHSQILENFVVSGTMLLAYQGCETKVIVPEGITVIGQRAFAGNEAVDRIELPDSVVGIGREAFAGCVVLQSIVLPAGVEWMEEATFQDCVKLIRVHLPEKLTKIPAACFKHCHALQEFCASETLRIIDSLAFYDCRKLREIVLPDTVENIGDMAFYGCRVLKEFSVPVSCQHIGELAFARTCVQIQQTQVLDSEKSKREKLYLGNVFAAANVVQGTVVIAEGTKKIEPYAFFCNDRITALRLPDSLEEIGEVAFYGCRNLRSVQFPKRNLVLRKGCFEKCFALEEVTAFSECVPERAFAGCRNLQRLQMEETHTIQKEAFCGCVHLQKVQFPCVQYIGQNAFSLCDSLESVLAGADVFLDAFCFLDCGSLWQITLREWAGITAEVSVRESYFMESTAFRGCTSLKQINYRSRENHISDTWIINGYDILFDDTMPQFVRQICASAWSVYVIHAKRELAAYTGFAEKVTIPYGIKSIGREAFRDKENLKEIVIPDSVCQIGARAFDRTQWLQDRKAENPLVVWHGILIDGTACKGRVVIPDQIHTISGWAFANNMDLTELVFEGNTHVEEYALRNCIYLEKVIVCDRTEYTIKTLSDRERTQPPLVSQIIRECYNCFKMEGDLLVECTGNIERLKLPGGIRRIGREVFRESNLLTSILLNGEVTEIAEGAFLQCKWLQTVKCASSVNQIGKKAFSGCIRLEEISGLGTDVVIGEKAFEDCISLKNVF